MWVKVVTWNIFQFLLTCTLVTDLKTCHSILVNSWALSISIGTNWQIYEMLHLLRNSSLNRKCEGYPMVDLSTISMKIFAKLSKDLRQPSNSNFSLTIFNMSLSLFNRPSFLSTRIFKNDSNFCKVWTDDLIASVLDNIALEKKLTIRKSLKFCHNFILMNFFILLLHVTEIVFYTWLELLQMIMTDQSCKMFWHYWILNNNNNVSFTKGPVCNISNYIQWIYLPLVSPVCINIF